VSASSVVVLVAVAAESETGRTDGASSSVEGESARTDTVTIAIEGE